MKLIYGLAIGVALSLTACALRSTAPAPVISKVPVSAISAEGSLPPQQLANGECGLFLWTQRDPRTFIFFARAAIERAQVSYDGAGVDLALAGAAGDLFGQFLTRMDYADASGAAWVLEIEPGEIIEDGQRIKSASLTRTDAEGWQTVIPVVGVRACKLEE